MQFQIFVFVWMSCAYVNSQENLNLTSLIDEIFTDPTTTRPQQLNRGFGVVVTPEPFVEPTQEPQTIVKANGEKCVCVPYYLCNPETNSTFTDGALDGLGRIDIRFGENECQDILDVCCKEGKTTTVPVIPPPTARPTATGCGVRNVNGIDFTIKVNTKSAAEFAEFPWVLALLENNNRYFCGASLIHPQVALTGIHCIVNRQMNDFKVRAGEWDTQTEKERLPYEERNVRQIIMHPEYNSFNLFNDFALIILDKAFDLSDHISTICLPPQNFQSTSQNCISNGWGKDIFGQAGKFTVILKKIALPMVPNDNCEQQFRATRLGLRFNLHPSFVCAGGQKGVDTCQGDGGSPLSCPIQGQDSRHYLAGMVAWGIGCNEERPAAYANVAGAREWVDQQMNSLGFGTNSYQI